jgi:acyl-CoA thioester hydrolase
MVNKAVAHPWLCDALGHLTTRNYLAMFDDASYHLLAQVFDWPGAIHESGKFACVDVRNVIDYQAEVSAGEILEVRGGLVKIGTKSITVRYVMTNLSSNETAATLEAIYAFFDMEARNSIPLTDEMRENAARHLLPSAE